MLPPEAALMVWDKSLPMLRAAVDAHPGEWPEDLEALRESVELGERLLVHIIDDGELRGVAMLEFVNLTDGKCLHVRYLGGEGMADWLPALHARLREIALAYDCQWMGLIGRCGWKRALANMGWRPMAITMRYAI